jgi:hypothetical protein
MSHHNNHTQRHRLVSIVNTVNSLFHHTATINFEDSRAWVCCVEVAGWREEGGGGGLGAADWVVLLVDSYESGSLME